MLSKIAKGAMRLVKQKKLSRQQLAFNFGTTPKSRKWSGKFALQGDARAAAVLSTGVGAGAVGVGEGVRRARSPYKSKRKSYRRKQTKINRRK